MKHVNDFKVIEEINQIISEIETELNQLSIDTKKHLANTVYILGNDYLKIDSDKVKQGDKYYAFVIAKSSWITGHKITLELKSSLSISENPNELSSVKYKIDDYKLYKNKENIYIFDVESLIKIKHFLLSFIELD